MTNPISSFTRAGSFEEYHSTEQPRPEPLTSSKAAEKLVNEMQESLDYAQAKKIRQLFQEKVLEVKETDVERNAMLLYGGLTVASRFVAPIAAIVTIPLTLYAGVLLGAKYVAADALMKDFDRLQTRYYIESGKTYLEATKLAAQDLYPILEAHESEYK